MSGLPEIEVVKRDLEKEVVGRRIKDVDVRPGPHAMKVISRHGRRKEFEDLLVGSKVDRVARIGTHLLLDLDSGRVLVIDLDGSGELLKTSASDELAPHTRLVIGFTIGGQLRLMDRDKSTQVFVIPKDDPTIKELRDFLLDPLGQPIAWTELSALLAQRPETAKELLLDDTFIVGLGDVYSDEVLFGAGIRHDRRVDRLTSQDVRRLYRALMETLQDAVRARGTSHGEDGFRDLQGQPGMFQDDLKVYSREGEPCRRCRSTIVKEGLDQGATYYCPQCQS